MHEAANPSESGAALLAPRGRIVVVRLLILLGLAAWVFWPELRVTVDAIFASGDWSHSLAAPLLILLLVYQRRQRLAEALTSGSVWGIVVLALGLAMLAANLWPLDFTYLRLVALVPVCAGAVLATGGWRVLRWCLPMLLVLWLSLPIGARQYATLTIRPETYTLAATRLILDALPGVVVTQSGPDLDFARGEHRGTVALGEPRRGAALVVTYIMLGVCVAFARVRPAWQVVVLALLAGPIALLCNLVRLVGWGLLNIYARLPVESPWPRILASGCALLLAFGSFAVAAWVLAHLVEAVEDEPQVAEGDVSEV